MSQHICTCSKHPKGIPEPEWDYGGKYPQFEFRPASEVDVVAVLADVPGVTEEEIQAVRDRVQECPRERAGETCPERAGENA